MVVFAEFDVPPSVWNALTMLMIAIGYYLNSLTNKKVDGIVTQVTAVDGKVEDGIKSGKERDERIDQVKEIVVDNETRQNSRSLLQLRLHLQALEKLANASGNPEDLVDVENAKKRIDEHIKEQASLDEKHEAVRAAFDDRRNDRT